MTGLLTLKDSIRDFLRKYDEITTPIIRFIAAIVLFISINNLFGYSDLFQKGMVVFLISVLCALLSGGFTVFIAGVVMGVNAATVSLDVGGVYIFLFIIMYCMYIRLFPKCSWLILFTPVLFMLKLQFMLPLIAVIFAGASGIIPVAFGVVLYYFAEYTKEIYSLLETAGDQTEIAGYSLLLKGLAQDKEMILIIIVFAIVTLVTYLIYRMSFDFSWYIAIGVGAVLTIIVYIIGGYALDSEVDIVAVLLGSILGAVIAVVVQFCKGMVDYSRKEKVQYEDDEYYYYVTAIPKLNVVSKDVNVKVMNKVTNKNKNSNDNNRKPQAKRPVNSKGQAQTNRTR